MGAIDKILQYLKLYRETPKNGLVVFAGNISDDQSKNDIQLFSMEPPEPMKVNIYRCDSTFLPRPDRGDDRNKGSLCAPRVDGRDAIVATLKGTHIRVIHKLHSMAHAKMSKGGQSAARFARARGEDIKEYYKRIGEVINQLFPAGGVQDKGTTVRRPGPERKFLQGRNDASTTR